MNVLDAAKFIKDYCEKFGDACHGCVFTSEDGCMFYANLPYDWELPDLGDDSQHIAPIADAGEDIQHVGYDAAQLGREK